MQQNQAWLSAEIVNTSQNDKVIPVCFLVYLPVHVLVTSAYNKIFHLCL